MPYAIEMFFDEVADAGVRSCWKALAAVGVPSLLESGSRPHITLAVAGALEVPSVCRLLERFAAATPPFKVSLASLGLFPGSEPVAFLAPKVTPELLDLHARFFAEFATLAQDIWQHYFPPVWVPHCTLAMRARLEKLSTVFDTELPMSVTLSGLSLVEFSPVRELYSTLFSNERNG